MEAKKSLAGMHMEDEVRTHQVSTVPMMEPMDLEPEPQTAMPATKNSASEQELQTAVRLACAEGCWGLFTAMMEDGCNAQRRETILRELLDYSSQAQGYWHSVMLVVKQGVACELRNRVILQAASEGQWSCVEQLTRLGVGAEQRDRVLTLAVAQGDLQCASLLIRLGVDSRVKETALTRAMEAGQGDFVLELARLCDLPDLTNWVIRGAVAQSQWQLVDSLVRLKFSLYKMGAVCKKAVGCGKWDCVVSILRGGLVASQWHVDEAFKAGAAQRIVSLLDVSTQKDLKSLILGSALKHGQHDVYIRVAEDHLPSDAEQRRAFEAAVHTRDEEFFYKLITDTRNGLRVFKSSMLKKVWSEKQATWICDLLGTKEEADLVIQMAAACCNRNSYSYFYTMFDKSSESRKMSERIRQFLLSEDALGIIDFTETYLRKKADKRSAFLWALRKGDLSTALRASDSGEHLCCSDLEFAVRMVQELGRPAHHIFGYLECCGKNKANKMVQFALGLYLQEALKTVSKPQLFSRFESLSKELSSLKYDNPGLVDFFKFSLDMCLASDIDKRRSADCFVQICNKLGKKQGDWNYAVDQARKCGKDQFLSRLFFEVSSKANAAFLYKALVKSSFSCEEDPFKYLVSVAPEMKDFGACLDFSCSENSVLLTFCRGLFLEMLKRSLSVKATWAKVMPVLENWIREEGFQDFGNFLVVSKSGVKKMKKQEKELVPSASRWCLKHSCEHIALFLALMTQKLSLVTKVLKEVKDPLVVQSDSVAHLCTTTLHRYKQTGWEPIFTVFHALEKCQYNIDFHEVVDPVPESILPEVIQGCKDEKLVKWEIYFRCKEGASWDIVENLLESCSDKKVIDYVIMEVVDDRQMDLVERVLDRCTQWTPDTKEPLGTVLYNAVMSGRVSMVEKILPNMDANADNYCIDSCYIANLEIAGSILLMAVTETEGAMCEKMVGILIRAGVSTFQPNHDAEAARVHDCALFRAVRVGKLRVAKLLVASGAVSNSTLHKIKELFKLTWGMRMEDSEEHRKNIVQFLNQECCSPRRLEDLSRLCVSHCVGTRPVRDDRIQSLPAPQPIKDLVAFKDLFEESRFGGV